MNERIQELAEQAMVSVSYRVCQNTFKETEDPLGPLVRYEFSKEKFAELIVRECAKFLEENSGYDDANNAWYPDPEDMLKHFGVK